MVFSGWGTRLASALLRTAGIVGLAMLALTVLTGGLGGLAILMGGFAYLPAALLATPIVYIDWLNGSDINTRWLPEDNYEEAAPEASEEAPR